MNTDDGPSPAALRTLGWAVLSMGVVLLAVSIVFLASGKQSGRTEYSGLVLGAAFVAYGAFNLMRSGRTG